ncbi:MAG TPA: hypothetical protein VF598_01745 [Hymenobacter sp.]
MKIKTSLTVAGELTLNGPVQLSNNTLYLSGVDDENHRLLYDDNWDGPILHGYSAVRLQTSGGNGITVNAAGDLYCDVGVYAGSLYGALDASYLTGAINPARLPSLSSIYLSLASGGVVNGPIYSLTSFICGDGSTNGVFEINDGINEQTVRLEGTDGGLAISYAGSSGDYYFNGHVSANYLSGQLNASNLTGAINPARIPALPYLPTAGGTMAANAVINIDTSLTISDQNVDVTVFSYQRAYNTLYTETIVQATGGFSGSGALLIALNGSNISSGTINPARFPSTVAFATINSPTNAALSINAATNLNLTGGSAVYISSSNDVHIDSASDSALNLNVYGGPVNVGGPASFASSVYVTGTVNVANRITAAAWDAAGSGAWVNMPTTGASGIGSGGAGVNPWIAYAASNGHWFGNSTAGSVCYRNTSGDILMGAQGNFYQVKINSGGIVQQLSTTAIVDGHLSNNGVSFYTDGTHLKIKLRGNDGVIRTGTVTLS